MSGSTMSGSTLSGSTMTTSVSTTAAGGVPDCTSSSEAGAYPNADDCKMFYACESDNNGGYVVKEYTCPGSLVFDPVNSYCNLASLVPGC